MKIAIVTFFIAFNFALAQQDTTYSAPITWTFDLHGGVALPPFQKDVLALLGANYSYSHHLFQFRHLVLQGDADRETAFLYGYKSTVGRRLGSFGISAGVGYVEDAFQYISPHNFEKSSVFGVALQVSYIYPIFDFLGLGVTSHYNYNSVRILGGTAISLHLGKFYENF